MTIELYETTRVRSIWFVQCKGMDILGAVLRQEGEPWELRYRFRHYEDEHAFESKDRKVWYCVTADDDSEARADKLVDAMNYVADQAAALWKAQVDRIDVNGTGYDAMDALHTKGWAHSSAKVPPADA
jgi:hypothetical protein